MNVLIDRIMSIVNERLDNSQQCKNIFNKNSMQPAIYQILCEIKDKIGKIRIISKQKLKHFFLVLNTRQLPSNNDQSSEQLIRVDNMLIAEGISERCLSINNSFDHSDYQIKLFQIKQIYNFELKKYENHCNDFCSHVRTLLREQSQIRPINEHEIEWMIMIIRNKFSKIQLQLKQSTCEAIMILRSRFLDARFENSIYI
jgi:pre-B-cell leukemia transcription factor 1